MRVKAARPFAFVVLGVAPVLLMSACGDDATGARTTLEEIQPSSYVVREPATTTTSIAPGTVDAEGRSPVEQEYTVQSGDTVFGIASDFGITADELAAYNDWPNGINQSIFPGDTIKIPPNALVPGSTGTDTDTDTETETASPTTAGSGGTATTLPPSDECTTGTYTITADDTSRLAVAERFDVTVEQLDAANANTPGYSAFYPGLEIVIPCVGE